MNGYRVDIHTGKQAVTNGIELPGFRVDVVAPDQDTGVDLVQVDYATLVGEQPYTWAPERHDDPSAETPLNGGKDIEQFARSLQGYINNGYVPESISIVGHASDEDPSENPSGRAGLDIKDAGNELLAQMRADAAKEQLINRLSQFMSDEEIDKIDIKTSGHEVQDPVINQLIRDFATRRGMTEAEWVMGFNEGTIADAEPDEVATFRTFSITHRTTDFIAEVEKVTVTDELEDGQLITMVLVPGVIPIPYVYRNKQPIPAAKKRKIRIDKGRTIPENVGEPHPGYQKVQLRRKQPGNINNGGRHGSRGQRNRGTHSKR